MKQRVFLVIFGVLTGILIGEVSIRLLSGRVIKADFTPRDDTRIFSPTRGYEYKPDSSRNFTGLGIPVIWHFNNFGFRDRAFSINRPIGKVYRIAFLGDSMVMGLGVEDYQALPRQLELTLQPKAYSPSPQFFEVFNFGLWGSTASQTYTAILKEKVLQLKPDLVILGWFSSDSGEAAANERDKKYLLLRSLPDLLIPYKFNEFLKNNSYLYLFFLNRYYNLVELAKAELPENKILISEGWKITDEELSKMKKLTDKAGTKFLLVGIPNIAEIENPRIEPYADRQKRLSQISQKYGITYVDLKEYLLRRKDFRSFYIDGVDTHFNPKGNEYIAGILADYLNKTGLIPID